MTMHGKKYNSSLEKVDRLKKYQVEEAFNMLSDVTYAKFDSTVDVAFRLGVDPTKSDQNIRSAVVLPHGTGKTLKVLVFAKGDKAAEAEKAGACQTGAFRAAKCFFAR